MINKMFKIMFNLCLIKQQILITKITNNLIYKKRKIKIFKLVNPLTQYLIFSKIKHKIQHLMKIQILK